MNDVLAMKLIESGQYKETNEVYSPMKIFEFIIAIFKPQSDIQRINLSFEPVTVESANLAISYGFDKKCLQP